MERENKALVTENTLTRRGVSVSESHFSYYPKGSQLIAHEARHEFPLDKIANYQSLDIPVDAGHRPHLSLKSVLEYLCQRATNWIHAAMKKRTESDSIKQKISTRRSMQNASFKRRFNKYKSGNQKRKLLSRSIIVAPMVLSLFEKQYSVFSSFIKDLEKTAEKNRILIDLSKVRKAKVSALLVLYANIERLQKVHDDRSIIKTTKLLSREVAVMFRTFGLWTLTGESTIHSGVSYPDSLEICTMSHEANAHGDRKVELRKILTYAKKSVEQFGVHEGSLLVVNAITESISNVWQHAYDDSFFKEPVPIELRSWWIIVQCIQDQFFVSMYDMGAGIPKTINSKPWAADLLESITKFLETTMYVIASPDAKSIKAAVDYGKSRFKLDNRGKGLTEAKDFVQLNPEGSLLIFSGYGRYTYRTKDDKEVLDTLSSQFKGTLIQWNLKLEKKDEA
ncbi:hypothetical protein [Pseudomonas syringae]|uniref:hypothetical protein n=1 Tax=Pseudomonas syringae TaxID=317 RepID=UPI003F84955A